MRTPDGPAPAPVVQRLRVRYAKRGRMRFSSHRDFQRALERALRRSGVPMAYSAGFHPHPKISFANAAPTGSASEAEYVELALSAPADPQAVRQALDASLPPGLDVLDVVVAADDVLADRLEASEWVIRMPGLDRATLQAAVTTFVAAERIDVERLTKRGPRVMDARGPVVSLRLLDDDAPAAVADPHPDDPALHLIIRHVTPTVRPNDVLVALQSVAGLSFAQTPISTRLRQGPLRGEQIDDPIR